MTKTDSLYGALAAFQAEMPRVAKDKTANVAMKGGGSFRYTYTDLASLTAAAMPLLTKHGLTFITTPRRTDRGYELVGILAHTTGETVEGALPITGNAAQEIGSSLTYGRRYLLGCMTGIVTDDDDDGSIANEAEQRRQRKHAEATQARRELHDWTQKSGIPPAEVGRRFEADYGVRIFQADAEQVRAFQHLLAEETAAASLKGQPEKEQIAHDVDGSPA